MNHNSSIVFYLELQLSGSDISMRSLDMKTFPIDIFSSTVVFMSFTELLVQSVSSAISFHDILKIE